MLLRPPGKEALPMNKWANLLQQLQNWVRYSAASAQYFISHTVMRTVLKERYFAEKPAAEAAIFMQLARFYRNQADPSRDGFWRAGADQPRALMNVCRYAMRMGGEGGISGTGGM